MAMDRLYDLESLATSGCVELDDTVEAHDLEEGLRVHALCRAEVGTRLLEGRHRSANAVNSSDARDQRED